MANDAESSILLSGEPIGEGKERICYQHPDFEDRVIKIPNKGRDAQHLREIKFYADVKDRGLENLRHVPRFYGLARTNLGEGTVVEKIRDYDGKVSRPISWYIKQGCDLADFAPYLHEIRVFFFTHKLVFNHDMGSTNLFLRKKSPGESELVAIDGLGDVVLIQYFNRFDWIVLSRLERRWGRFVRRLYRRFVKQPGSGEDVFPRAYRRQISDTDYERSIGRYLPD